MKYRWHAFAVIVMVAWLLPLQTHSAEHTPLPSNLKIVPPDSAIPPEVAAFSGKWAGKWGGLLDSTLVVTKIEPGKKGGHKAELVYSWGTYSPWFIHQAGYREMDGEIKDGQLTAYRGRETHYQVQDLRGP